MAEPCKVSALRILCSAPEGVLNLTGSVHSSDLFKRKALNESCEAPSVRFSPFVAVAGSVMKMLRIFSLRSLR